MRSTIDLPLGPYLARNPQLIKAARVLYCKRCGVEFFGHCTEKYCSMQCARAMQKLQDANSRR